MMSVQILFGMVVILLIAAMIAPFAIAAWYIPKDLVRISDSARDQLRKEGRMKPADPRVTNKNCAVADDCFAQFPDDSVRMVPDGQGGMIPE